MDPNKNSNLKNYISRRIKHIKKKYTIVNQVLDGCDRYGFKYWAECKNGETYRNWEVNNIINKEIDNLYNDISNGFYFNDTVYYFNIQKLKILFYSISL